MKSWTTHNGYVISRLIGGRSNAYLLSNGDKNLLIDTGPKWMRPVLLRRLSRLGIGKLDAMILTHSHEDHVGSAAALVEKFDMPVYIHRAEAVFLLKGRMVIPAGTNPFSYYLVKWMRGLATRLYRYTPCRCDVLLDDRYDLDAFGIKGYILHTPGHSAGSVSIVVDDEFALIGDVMLGRGEHYTFPPFADEVPLLLEIWDKLLATPCHTFLPSHGWEIDRKTAEKVNRKKKKQKENKVKG